MESILFVCLGNICRSPTAKAVFDYKLQRAGLSPRTDSAGTTGYHQGRPPDPRAIRAASHWGVDISGERARIVTVEDFTRFERIYAMDRSNLADLRERMPVGASARVELLMSLAPDYGLDEVPDPYYGGEEGFRRVLDMLETAADRLIEELGASTRP
jgi:protein-tyrosine phosphatase